MTSPPTGKEKAQRSHGRALEGLRVLDFSHALAGPYCTLLLADYGAEVYKLESPQGGELSRGWGPPFIGGEASFFLGLNRGKKGIAIDLKKREGIELCLRLLDRMDVLIENFRPGTMERLGLGYEAVRARNPRLVYCSISGYGQDGPSREEAAMDLVVEASSGFMSITGAEDGEPVRAGYAVADINAGLFAVIGILMAVQHRNRTGAGQYVDVSMFDGMISAMSSNYMAYLGSGRVPKPMGSAFPTVVPYRVFQASDRGFALAVGSEKLWAAFCRAIAHPELQTHADYASNAQRIQNRRALEDKLQEIFRQGTAAEWVSVLSAVGVPCCLLRTFEEVVQHPQAEFRKMFPWIEHPAAGKHRVTGPPIKLSETPGRPTTAAPRLGQDTANALAALLGMKQAEIERLIADGIIPPQQILRQPSINDDVRESEAR
ncbi:MAG TPA: CoA transferase [Candidatus Acidoferrum sp.]|nr:CoA transferase [Candidatus Acidoferrum sp.]